MTATYPPRTSMRPCRLYRFYVTHPLTGEVVLGYVGETGRQPFERLLEHLATQPWFDTVVRWEVDPQVFYGKQAVLEAETATIRAELPLYNVKGNERNGQRIPPPVAIRQRRARDAQNGDDRWVHPDDRPVPVRQGSSRRPVARKPWRPWQRRLTGWGSAWLISTLAAWIFAALERWGSLGQTFTGAAMTLPGGLMLLWLCLEVVAGSRRRRKVFRKIRRWGR